MLPLTELFRVHRVHHGSRKTFNTKTFVSNTAVTGLISRARQNGCKFW